jgi:NADPH:quinone reductase-like Zn-dependent oxidoreductase
VLLDVAYAGCNWADTQVRGGITEGWLKVPIEGVFPLGQAADMHRRLEGRHVAGKLLLRARPPS